jgi:hypothetical protein
VAIETRIGATAVAVMCNVRLTILGLCSFSELAEE